MTKIMIPKCRNPFVVIMNGIRYEYESGKEVEVPDEVAEVIQFHVDSKPKALPYVGGGGVCNRPHVYFSDGFDKLPTDAVEGSMAVVNATLDGEIWRFNDEIDISEITNPLTAKFASEADQSLYTFEGLSVGETPYGGSGIYCLNYTTDGNGSQPAYVVNPENKMGITSGWKEGQYGSRQIITLYEASEDAMTFIEKNAIFMGNPTATTLYSRINGEWVSQGEVDFTDLASV